MSTGGRRLPPRQASFIIHLPSSPFFFLASSCPFSPSSFPLPSVRVVAAVAAKAKTEKEAKEAAKRKTKEDAEAKQQERQQRVERAKAVADAKVANAAKEARKAEREREKREAAAAAGAGAGAAGGGGGALTADMSLEDRLKKAIERGVSERVSLCARVCGCLFLASQCPCCLDACACLCSWRCGFRGGLVLLLLLLLLSMLLQPRFERAGLLYGEKRGQLPFTTRVGN